MTYDQDQAKRMYSFWAKSLIAYNLGILGMGPLSRIRRRAIDSLELKKGEHVLEIACGPANSFSRIQNSIGPTGKVTGVDITPEMIAHAKRIATKNRWKNVKLIEADASKTALPKCDKALSIIGLSATADPRRIIRKVHAALKKGGVFVVLDSREPTGPARFVIPLIRWSRTYEYFDVEKEMNLVFGNASVTICALGTVVLVRSRK